MLKNTWMLQNFFHQSASHRAVFMGNGHDQRKREGAEICKSFQGGKGEQMQQQVNRFKFPILSYDYCAGIFINDKW